MRTNRSLIRALVVGLGVTGLILASALPALAGGSSVKGTVTNTSGAPVTSVWVIFSQGNTEHGKSLTGDDGRYYVGGLKPGKYTVTVRKGEKILFHGVARVPTDKPFDIRIG